MKYKAPVDVCVIHKSRMGKLHWLHPLRHVKVVSDEMFGDVSAFQMPEKSQENPVNSTCEASLNISHDTLCSGKMIFFSVIYLSSKIIIVFIFGISYDEKNS